MPRPDLCRRALGLSLLVGLAAAGPALTSAAEPEPLLRHRATLTIEQAATLVRLPLPVSVYARVEQASLADLRLHDATGARVPFALLAPRPDEVLTHERWHEATLYRLPPRPASANAGTAGGTWAAPVELTVDGGGRINVRTRGAPAPAATSPGWLFDLGERAEGEPRPRTLKLSWSGPAEFTVAYALEHSADLKLWRAAPGGQVMALASSAGALTLPDIALPADAERFVRLVWAGPAPRPELTGARVGTPVTRAQSVEPPVEIVAGPSAEPGGATNANTGSDAARRALHFDLGASVPLVRLDLRWPTGTHLLPVRVQARERADARWDDAGATVFYRYERGAEVQSPPSFALQRRARYIRLVPDERVGDVAGSAAGSELRLVAQAQLASLVFAAQGAAPYVLLAGSAKAPPGALPLATLVPGLELDIERGLQRERARFGLASLGPWSEVGEAALQARSQERQAALRPWLLWGVLGVGVAGLALMVWRLARGARGGAGG